MSITNLLAQTATIYPKSGYNKFGRDTSGAGTLVRCRFQNVTKTKLQPDQSVIVLVGTFYFDGSVTINTEDRILYNSLSYKVFTVNDSVDGRGRTRLIRVDVQKWQT